MRWPRANLEEKQEPRAATSGSAERRAEGMWHDVTRKGLTEAAIEKRTFRRSEAKVGFVPGTDIRARLLCRTGLLLLFEVSAWPPHDGIRG